MVGSIEALMAPRNVAIVGASDRNWSPRVRINLQRFGFEGRVYPVNPNRPEIWGETCWPDLRSLPEAPDHLALLVPREQTLEALALGGALGARSASLFAAGFGEGADPQGRSFAVRLRNVLEQYGIAAVGPNCMGLAVARSGLCTFPDEQLEPMTAGDVAVLTQSGMLGQTFCRGLIDAGVTLSCLVSCGNQIGLTFADYIDYLAEQPALRVIVCYIESVVDSQAFLDSAERAREKGKQLVVMKAGGSREARSASIAHTGSLAGDKKVFDAFARRSGILSVDNLEDMVEATVYFSKMRAPSGPRVAVMTNSGALKTLMTDAASVTGLVFSELESLTGSSIRDSVHDAVVSNPFDTKRTLATDEYVACLQALHDDPSVDLVLVAEELPREAGIRRKELNAIALNDWAAGARKPVVAFSPLTLNETAYMSNMRRACPNVPALRDLTKTFRVLSKIADLSASASSSHAEFPGALSASALDCDWRRCAQELSSPTPLSETASKRLLRRYGFATPTEQFVRSESEVAEAAEKIGYPVVLKGVSAAAPHKTEAGLVVLGLGTSEEIVSAAHDIRKRCGSQAIPLEGFLVAEQVTGGVELAVGIHRDPEMGLAVVAALGGVWVELFKDVIFLPPNLDVQGALREIQQMRSYPLLAGYRGAEGADVQALAQALVALGRMARDIGDHLEAVDVNPLLVLAEGRGVLALDGLVVLRSTSSARDC